MLFRLGDFYETFGEDAERAAPLLGITLTSAGAAFPYGNDVEDRHIRIAPSFPSLDEISQAAKGIALALRVAIAG